MHASLFVSQGMPVIHLFLILSCHCDTHPSVRPPIVSVNCLFSCFVDLSSHRTCPFLKGLLYTALSPSFLYQALFWQPVSKKP